MENIYEEEIVKEACRRLEKAKGIKIELLDISATTDMNDEDLIVMNLKMGDHTPRLSCHKGVFHDTSRAITLPNILKRKLVKPELQKTLNERSFIILCFAAWFYEIGKYFNYF